jgi:hypothetical protein
LTREVLLPDQSVRIVKAARNTGKSYLTKRLWKPVDAVQNKNTSCRLRLAFFVISVAVF